MAYGKKRSNSKWNPSWKKKEQIVPGSQFKAISHPSDEQKAIFDAVLDGNDSLMIGAYAGTGKTTVCTNAMHRVIQARKGLSQKYIVFAKRNREEAVAKCPESAYPQTSHSFGLNALSSVYGKIDIDNSKTNRIAAALVGPDDDVLCDGMTKAIDLAKDYLATTQSEVEMIVDKHGIEIGDCGMGEFTDKVLRGMNMSAEQTKIASFSDMTWLPIRLGLKLPTFDLLYSDECQDLNKARQELVLRALGSRGRLIAVGDENQAIFGFSGADRAALANLRSRANAIDLPLHRTYRCGKAIVEFSKQYVPDYEAAESNEEGTVEEATIQHMLSSEGAKAGDFILSRTNAPCIRIALRFLKEGRKANIQGKDIGSNLLWMIKRSKAIDVMGFQSWLVDWANAEIERRTVKNANANVDYILDTKECLEAFCEGMRDLNAVKSNISGMFDDNEKDEEHRITISTSHRSKGLERNRVWALQSSFTCIPKTTDDIEAERCVRYVTYTRARDSLFLVNGKL